MGGGGIFYLGRLGGKQKLNSPRQVPLLFEIVLGFQPKHQHIKVQKAMLGKKKRVERVVASRTTLTTSKDSLNEDGDLQALFRQHFESRFKPLEGLPPQRLKRPQAEDESPEDQSHSDWDALSDGQDEKQVEVVEHIISKGGKRAEVPREEIKTFMV